MGKRVLQGGSTHPSDSDRAISGLCGALIVKTELGRTFDSIMLGL